MLTDRAHVERLSRQWGVPADDVLLIALNACGMRSDRAASWLRFPLLLDSSPDEQLYMILPLGRRNSPFELVGDRIWLNGQRIATVPRGFPGHTFDEVFPPTIPILAAATGHAAALHALLGPRGQPRPTVIRGWRPARSSFDIGPYDGMLFENRTWHAGGRNSSGQPRLAVMV